MRLLNHLCAVACVLAAASAAANSPSPYAGEEGREISSRSPSEVADLLAGKGMGYAKSAELNGYPGPLHVLELASQLRLSEPQLAQTQDNFKRMQKAARELGARLIEAERALDASFRSRAATPETLTRDLQRIAQLEASLREVHLAAHLEQTRLLSPGQVADYVRLRGYRGGGEATGHGRHQGHHHGHQ